MNDAITYEICVVCGATRKNKQITEEDKRCPLWIKYGCPAACATPEINQPNGGCIIALRCPNATMNYQDRQATKNVRDLNEKKWDPDKKDANIEIRDPGNRKKEVVI